MVSHICLLVELGPICNTTAASLCLKSCVDHSLLKSYNGGLWKNIYRSGPFNNVMITLTSSRGSARIVELTSGHCIPRVGTVTKHLNLEVFMRGSRKFYSEGVQLFFSFGQ